MALILYVGINNNHKLVTSIFDPVNAQDVAAKIYVDNATRGYY
jgi:hypothetical protein